MHRSYSLQLAVMSACTNQPASQCTARRTSWPGALSQTWQNSQKRTACCIVNCLQCQAMYAFLVHTGQGMHTLGENMLSEGSAPPATMQLLQTIICFKAICYQVHSPTQCHRQDWHQPTGIPNGLESHCIEIAHCAYRIVKLGIRRCLPENILLCTCLARARHRCCRICAIQNLVNDFENLLLHCRHRNNLCHPSIHLDYLLCGTNHA